MKNIFWGFFFLFVNFNLTVNGHILNLLPPFVGCWLLYRGFEELRAESERFYALRPFAVGLGIYTALIWIGDLLGVSTGSWISVLLGIVASAVELYIAWGVIQGLREAEEHRQASLNTAAMYQAWMVLLVTQIAVYAIQLMGLALWSLATALAAVCIFAGLVGIILFLVAVWRSRKLYEALPPLQEEL